jgi:hypothetical protein
VDTWILAGQSNMQGFGPLDDPGRETFVDPRVEVLSSGGEWTDATEPLHRLWESYTPAHRDLLREGLLPHDRGLTDEQLAARDRSAAVGAGLGPAFASAVADQTGERVGLIPAAHGGTSLEQWAPSRAVSTLYGAMLDRAARASRRDDVRLAGVLWYQGESDATPSRSVDYADRFESWIVCLREDLGPLPVHVVQLGRFTGVTSVGELEERSWDLVRESQRLLPSRVADTGVVSAVDLALSDPIHVGATALARLGRRLAKVVTGTSTPDVVRVDFVGPASNSHLVLRVVCSGVNSGWAPAEFLSGFRLTDRHGVPISRLSIVDARTDPTQPDAIRLVATPVERGELSGTFLTYGQGFDPVCLAVDGEDMPLPAFGPQRIVGL